MRPRHAFALFLAACAWPAAAPCQHASGARSRADRLAAAIETSDLEAAFKVLCDAYAAGGLPCAETVHLEPMALTDVMAHTDDEHGVHIPAMPRSGEGFAYWDNWSSILAGGAWQPHALFRDDDDARRVANMLLVTVMAHEIGHHLARRFECQPYGPAKELRADELSVPLLTGTFNARLNGLHARMRMVADAMIDAVPAAARVVVPVAGDLRAWVAAQASLPDDPRSYVTLHLSRQRRLLEERARFAPVAKRLCLVPHAQWIASRRPQPGRVRTVASFSRNYGRVIAIDRNGHVHAIDLFLDSTKVVEIARIDQPGPSVALPLPQADMLVGALAAYSDDRLAIADAFHAWLIEKDPAGRVSVRALGPVPDHCALAFDAQGNLLIAEAHDGAWYVGPVGGVPRLAAWHHFDSARGWADGPLATAGANPIHLALRGGRAIFFDHSRKAVRSAAADGIVTLAGSLPGRRDGDAAGARFFDVVALGALADGTIAVVEQTPSAAVLRVIEPRQR